MRSIVHCVSECPVAGRAELAIRARRAKVRGKQAEETGLFGSGSGLGFGLGELGLG